MRAAHTELAVPEPARCTLRALSLAHCLLSTEVESQGHPQTRQGHPLAPKFHPEPVTLLQRPTCCLGVASALASTGGSRRRQRRRRRPRCCASCASRRVSNGGVDVRGRGGWRASTSALPASDRNWPAAGGLTLQGSSLSPGLTPALLLSVYPIAQPSPAQASRRRRRTGSATRRAPSLRTNTTWAAT